MGSTLPKTLTLCSPQQKSHPQMDPRGPPLLSHRENSGLDLPSSPYLTVGPTSLWKSPSRKGTPPEALITHIQHPLLYPSPPQGVLGKPHPTESSPSRPRAGLRARAESSQQPERGRGALRPPRPGPPAPRGRSTLSRSSISFSWARRSYSSRVNSPRRVPTSSSAGARAAGAGVAVGAEGLGTTSSWASLQMERMKQSGHGVTGGGSPGTGPALPHSLLSPLLLLSLLPLFASPCLLHPPLLPLQQAGPLLGHLVLGLVFILGAGPESSWPSLPWHSYRLICQPSLPAIHLSFQFFNCSKGI